MKYLWTVEILQELRGIPMWCSIIGTAIEDRRAAREELQRCKKERPNAEFRLRKYQEAFLKRIGEA